MAGKKTGKRLLTWVLVLVMALSLLPLNALAEDYSAGNFVPGETTLVKGDTYTLDTDDASNLPEAPEGLRWDGPESIKGDQIICGKNEHQHDSRCYEWEWFLIPYRVLVCNKEEHIHSDYCYNHTYKWTLVKEGDITTSNTWRRWWPVYWTLSSSGNIKANDAIESVTAGKDVTYTKGSLNSAEALAGTTATLGDAVDAGGFTITTKPGYYVKAARVVCGNYTGCGVSDDLVDIGQTESNYKNTIEIRFDQGNNDLNFDHLSANGNGVNLPKNYPTSKPTGDDYHNVLWAGLTKNTLYPYYFLIQVAQDPYTYSVSYNWGDQELSNSVPGGKDQLKRNESYKVLAPSDEAIAEAAEKNLAFAGWKYNNSDTIYQVGESFSVSENVTLTAQWTQLYTVSYDLAGGSWKDGQTVETAKYPESAPVSVTSNEPEKSGNEFIDWTITKPETNPPKINTDETTGKKTFTMPAANVILKAQWKEIESPEPAPATVTLSDAEGYSLIKKHLTVNGDGLAEDTYFVAKLEAVNDLAKGVLSDSLSCSTSYMTATGNDVFTFNDTNDGNILTFSAPGEYTFKVTEENLGVKYMQYDDTVYTMTVNVTKGATENKLNAAVSFKNGDDPVNEGYITFNNTYTAPAYPVYVYAFFAHNSKQLKGEVTVNGKPIEWNEDAENGEYFVTLGVYPNGTTKEPIADATGLDLEALKGKEYVLFDGKGSGKANGVALNNITNYPSPYGKVCKGAAGYEESADNPSWHLDGQVDVYTVTYDDNGGTAQGAHTSNGYYFGSYTTDTAPKRDGYTFTGWKDGDTTYPPKENITLEKDLKLVANWEKDESQTQKTSYTVQHKVDGKIIDKDTQTYTNTAWINETDPTIAIVSGSLSPKSYDGYKYVGMEPEIITDNVASGTIITLTYEKRTDLSYTVHYYLMGTTKKVADDKTVDGQTFNAVVKEEAIRISGYRVYGNSVKSITIGTGTNEIIFYYTRASRPSTPSKPTLNTGDHYAYVMGYPDGTVRPNGSITRAEVSAILFRLLSDKTRDEYFTTESSFTDVKAGAWYNNSIATLEKAGVIVDTAKGGAFRPNEAITRAELAAMLAQFSDAKPVKGVKFSDVSAEHWAYEAIAIAAKMGWIEGYPDGTFRPDATITRAEMMTLVNRALERVPSDEDHLLSKRVMLTFPDCKSGDWFYIAVQEATNSHTYERAATEKNGDEQWTALRANRDWTLLEK